MIRSLLTVTVLIGVGSTSAVAQDTDRSRPWDPGYDPPRTVFGHPDLQGNWTNVTLTPFERPPGQEPVYSWDEVRGIEQPEEDCPPNPGTVACGRTQRTGISHRPGQFEAGQNRAAEPIADLEYGHLRRLCDGQ